MSDDEWSVEQAMQMLADELAAQGMSVEDVFAQFDTDDDGSINGPEFHKGLHSLLGEFLSPGQISSIIKAFDDNDDHRIDVVELKAALTQSNDDEEE